MSNFYFIFTILAIVFALLGYISTANIFCTLAIFLLSIVYFYFRLIPKINRSKLKTRRFHSCYHFINNYIITLSVKQSIKAAYKDNIEQFDDDLKKVTNSIEDLNDNEKLEYLSHEFPFHIYSLFLNIVNLWQEEGGDILKMSTQLINETRMVEEYLISAESLAKKKYVDFIILWSFSLAILIFLKFALKEFYDKMQKELFFIIAIGAFFAFLLLSIELLTNLSLKYDLKGWNNEKRI